MTEDGKPVGAAAGQQQGLAAVASSPLSGDLASGDLAHDDLAHDDLVHDDLAHDLGRALTVDDERREWPRIPVEMWVEESTDRELYFQRGANISIGGIYLQRTIPHTRGTVINMQFTLPGDATPIKVRGEIVNVGETADELGMGVKFLDLADADRQRVESFIRRMAAQKAPPA